VYAILTALVLTACAASQPTQGPAPLRDWDFLGQRRVEFRAERDVISVTSREGTFAALKFEVDGGNLDLYNVRVIFGNGDVFSPDTRLEFREGSWSRTIDLPGNRRVIKRIEFYYRSELQRGKATIKAYGRR
jgi:hypothetical protein